MSGSENSFGGSYGTPVIQIGDAPARPAANAPVEGLIKDTTTANFAKDVIQESRRQPVLVDFWAPWCGPCKQLTPVIERAVAAAGGKVKLVKMNIDDHPSIAGQLGIQSIPAVFAFVDGQPVDGFMGAIPESQVTEFINRLGGNGNGAAIEEALAAAAQARQAGDVQQAGAIYSSILAQAPDNVAAIAAFADLLFEGGDEEAAGEVLAGAPKEKADAPEIAAVRARIELAHEAAKLGDAGALEARLAENPKDHQASFDLAMIRNAEGRREEAADALLAIVKTDREWNDKAAQGQLLKFFEAWGMTDPDTLSARRKLSSILFS